MVEEIGISGQISIQGEPTWKMKGFENGPFGVVSSDVVEDGIAFVLRFDLRRLRRRESLTRPWRPTIVDRRDRSSHERVEAVWSHHARDGEGTAEGLQRRSQRVASRWMSLQDRR